MEVLKKISFRLLILILFLIGLNWVYKKYILENDLQKHSDFINLIREIPTQTDILYIGESSNDTFRGNDKDKRPISEMIGDFYPDLVVEDLTAYASHAGIFDVLIRRLDETTEIKTLVVTLNLRSFDANWIYSKLETALQKKLVLLKDRPPLYNRFLLSFKGYDVKSEREREIQFKRSWAKDRFYINEEFPYTNVRDWDQAIAKNGVFDKEGKWDQEMTNLTCHYVKTYAFEIDTLTNPRISDFNKIIDYGRSKGWNIAFNLLAENTEMASE